MTRIGRYTLLGELASGGMATVHLGRLQGDAGFQREVAIKRLQPRYAADPDFTAMLLDEARLVERIRHPHVVQVLDVVADASGLYVVMELVRGESLSGLIRLAHQRQTSVPQRVAIAMVIDALHGLHAAHVAQTEHGVPLGIVHRDVSPHNLMVGADGITRVLDFGVAKALGRSSATEEGQIKGKLAYMPPEQVLARPVDARTDVYAATIVLWELLAGRRLFRADSQIELLRLAAKGVAPESLELEGLDVRLMAVLRRGLEPNPERRFQSAQEMASELESLGLEGTRDEVGAFVRALAGERLAAISQIVNVEPLPQVNDDRTGPAINIDVATTAPRRRSRVPMIVAGLAGLLVSVAFALREPPTPPPPVIRAEPSLPPPPPVLVEEKRPEAIVETPKPVAKPARKKAPVKKADCSQPYELDAKGNPRFKRECLQ